MTRAVLKSNAKQQLKGKWGLAIIVCIIYTFITQASTASTSSSLVQETDKIVITLNIVGWLLYGPITAGLAKFTLNLARDKESAKFSDLFSQFKLFFKLLLMTIVINLAVVLGTMLLIVPGIILALMFSQSYYILVENPELSFVECLSRSASMMKGHKMELFILELSFLGWFILSIISFGIGFIWYMPYYEMTVTNFYLNLNKKEILDI
ncbi:DUF975 family protein [Romboutsia lituseburensis]|uniref:Uncharacterized membrane protein n=1 Tax=Romboutsia lituseburensis DSM 797 TaxID=1121325 RepID=A0A1G9IPR6_9FIRM|nr:DUF975 family protein [Romboutsia lituseburensis]CEH33816.1 Integral membrane protein [Romboutsia lituseburensis]SDL26943.1 Uncharacterized membrane protein [Romboutsia lituseburensis DSM 797]